MWRLIIFQNGYERAHVLLERVQFPKERENSLFVHSSGQGLLQQAADAPKVAAHPAQFPALLLVLNAFDLLAGAHPFQEGRERQTGPGGGGLNRVELLRRQVAFHDLTF